MIDSARLIDAVQEALPRIEEDGFDAFLLERDIHPDAVKALVRRYAQEIAEGAGDIGGLIVQSVIVGVVAGWAARDLQEVEA